MSGDPSEGAVTAAAEGAVMSGPDAPGAVAVGAPAASAAPDVVTARADAEAPRPARTVPRPSGAGPLSVRKPTLPGAADPPLTPLPPSSPGAPVTVPPLPPGSDGGEPLPRPPAMDASFDDAAPTERRPSVPTDDPGEGPPPVNRFLSPLPPAPRSEMPSGGAEGATRRRSRRTVKIPDDAIPQQRATPTPPEVAPAPPPIAAAPVAAPPPPVAAAPPPPPPERAPERPVSDRQAVPIPFIPPSPPVPTLTARGAPRPVPRVAENVVRPVEESRRPDFFTGPTAELAEAFEVIRPMRIISIGSQPPPAGAAPPPPAPPPPAPPPPPPVLTAPFDEGGWEEPRRASRPPMPASPELEAFAPPITQPQPSTQPQPATAAPAQPPPSRAKPPAVEEVEAISEEDEADASVVAPTLRTEEIESIPDDEVVPERISSHDAVDEIPVDVVDAPAPKKPPPPPPKRPADAAPASAPMPPVAAAPAAAPALGPPPPPAATPERPLAQTLDLGGRKRQKPWWEEVFSDDYLRTMEKTEPRIIRKECDFIDERLGLEKGAVMLDLACGAGAHAVELSSRGYNVVGYDLSLAMLARAQDEALERGQKINFLQGDIREMAFEEAFDGIYSWNTSFGYFDDEKNLNVLSRIRRALRQGGLLLLDVANRDYICPRQPSLVWFEGDGCVCMDEMHVDFFSSRLKVKRTVMFEDGRAREVEYAIRLYALHELGKMLHDTGFKVVEVTGHPAHPGVFFGSESPRIIVLAERA
jgi:SAM-dependent methyltransferase